jgi:hypothetical protein
MAKKLEEQFLGYIRDELSRQTDKEIEERVESYRKKLNSIKETPTTAKPKRGRPKEINRVVTKTSQSGLREGLTRATFIIQEETLDKLKERAYTDRKKLKDLVTEALNYYLDNTKAEGKDEVITNASLKLGTMLRVEDLSKEIRITIEKEKSNV